MQFLDEEKVKATTPADTLFKTKRIEKKKKKIGIKIKCYR